MRRIAYREVLRGASENSGRIFSVLSGDDAELFRGFISRRLKEAWEAQFWPELMVVEERTIASKVIPYLATGEEDIAAVMRITDADPQQTHKLVDYSFNLIASGINIPSYSADSTTLYVSYRKKAPILNGDNWAAGTYAAGAQVYHTTLGDFYDQGDSSSTALEPDASPWERVDIPWVFSTYLQRAAAADMLLLDEKEGALAQKAMAEDALMLEMANLRQQSQQTNIKIRTHRGAGA